MASGSFEAQILAWCDDRLKSGDSLDQYKSLLFDIFRAAYQQGACDQEKEEAVTGESIYNLAAERGWLDQENSEADTLDDDTTDVDSSDEAEFEEVDDEAFARDELLELICAWWDEWIYAWDEHPLGKSGARKTGDAGPD